MTAKEQKNIDDQILQQFQACLFFLAKKWKFIPNLFGSHFLVVCYDPKFGFRATDLANILSLECYSKLSS